jgi:alpha-N-arabinofuranosidase
VKHRSFEFPDPLVGWRKAVVEGARGSYAVRTDAPLTAANPHYVRITSEAGAFGLVNFGFRGMGIRKGERYTVSVHARRVGSAPATLRFELETWQNKGHGAVTIAGLTGQWARYTTTITAEVTDPRARFRVLVDAPGVADVDMVSLFPVDTFKGRENGMRPDIAQLLADLKPGFLRFPGGCIVEGRYLDGRYQWKNTIGPLPERRLIENRWIDENNRLTADYYQSFGLGFYEYFQLAEDIGAEPLPILNCGMACQFNSNELAPLAELDPYVQDALDLIEFANGPVTSPWGKRRAALGHPAPFNLKFLGVGNEQWGPQYVERYAVFHKILKAKHPEIRLIGSAGPSASGERFDFLWTKMREIGTDLVDEHYYMPPEWFLANPARYDGYPRTGPKVFAGEFAAHERHRMNRPDRPSSLAAALAEAAFMTGLERNADIVEMASYAPLLAHVDAWQWSPNLIWFDNLRVAGTPSYHVQKLFGQHRGARILPVSVSGAPASGVDGLFASASLDQSGRGVIVKLVNPGSAARTVALSAGKAGGPITRIVLQGAPEAENSLEQPTAVAPREDTLPALPAEGVRLEPHSLTILRIPLG